MMTNIPDWQKQIVFNSLSKIAQELELMRKLFEATDPVELGRLAKAFLQAKIMEASK